MQLDYDKHDANEIIDALGGTSAMARIFSIKPPSVHAWRTEGIPFDKFMYLELKYRSKLKKLKCFSPEVCPDCGSPNITERHFNGSFAVPKCDYKQCDDCYHQWAQK